MNDSFLLKCLKHMEKRFVWLQLDSSFRYSIPYGFGYIIKVHDDSIVFDSIDKNGKIDQRWVIGIDSIKGLSFKGPTVDKIRCLANLINIPLAKEPKNEISKS